MFQRGIFALYIMARALIRPVAFGVMGAVIDDEGRVLLVRHSYQPGWRLPGGGLDWGEPPDITVMRELAEEVGLTGGTLSLFALYARKVGLVTNLIAVYRITGATIAFRPNWEIREILFADPANPPPGCPASTIRRLRELSGAEKPARIW